MTKKTEKQPIVIAIDGPSASGKGTVGRGLAAHLGMEYLDTGRLYRKVGQKLIKSGLNAEDAKDHFSKVAQFAAKLALGLKIQEIEHDNLASEEIGKAASIVAAIPGVRKALLDFQHKVAASPNGAVIDGRDIGTVVCPDADLKLFITANLKARAERRYKELQKQDNGVIYSNILRDLQERDERDSGRKISPLQPAEDAIVIDTTTMDIKDVFEKVLSIIPSSAS